MSSIELITIVELEEFKSFVKKHLTESEKIEIINYIAANPDCGDIMQGTGGLRKFRWAREGGRKSGGYRIIHYYYNNDIPVFLITGFAKNEMENLTQADKNAFKSAIPMLINAYKIKGAGNDRKNDRNGKEHIARTGTGDRIC